MSQLLLDAPSIDPVLTSQMSSVEFPVLDNDETKKRLFEFIRERKFNGDISIQSIHESIRLTSLVSELSCLVRIKSTPKTPTKDLTDYIKKRFMQYGVPETQIHTPEYTQVLEGSPCEQNNIFVEFPNELPNDRLESIVVSGHLDTVDIDKRRLSENPDDENYFGTTWLRDHQRGVDEARLYGFGTNDMKNIFSVMIQLAKERYFLQNPGQFQDEYKWLFELVSEGKLEKDSVEEYFREIIKGHLLDCSLEGKTNRLIFLGTSGEEKAGHDGLVSLLGEYYAEPLKGLEDKKYMSESLRNSAIWLIAEPSSGFVDAHKGYSAVKVRFEYAAYAGKNSIEDMLKLVSMTTDRHNSREGLIPYEIKDRRFTLPTLNIGTVRGFSCLENMERILSPNPVSYLRISTTGKKWHSSEPKKGESAISLTSNLYKELKIIYSDKISAISVEGGVGRNTVAPLCDLVIGVSGECHADIIRTIEDRRKVLLSDSVFSETSISYETVPREKVLEIVRLLKSKLNSIDPGDYSEFDCEYRTMPGQEGLEEPLKTLASELELAPDITVERDSYPLDSRVKNLKEETLDKLLEIISHEFQRYGITGNLKPYTVNFSSEAGTVARFTLGRDVIPVLISSTSIDQAHQQDQEFITLDQMSSQFSIYSQVLSYLGKNPIRKSSGISVSSTLENFVEKEGLNHEDLRAHLDWFRERQEINPFGLVRIERKHVKDVDRLKCCISDFSEILGLYPIIVTDFSEFELRVPTRNLPYQEGENKLYFLIRNSLKNSEIPIISTTNTDGIDTICDNVVTNTQPLKYIFIENNGGLLAVRRDPSHDRILVLSRVDLNSIVDFYNNHSALLNESDFLGLLVNDEINGQSFKALYKAYRHFAFIEKEAKLTPKLRKSRSMQIVSQEDLFKELFTTQGAGTLIRRGFDIEMDMIEGREVYYEKDNVQKPQDYISGNGKKQDCLGFVVTSDKTFESQGRGRLQLKKVERFEVDDYFWRQDLPERLIDEIIARNKPFYWSAINGTNLSVYSPRLIEHAKGKGKFTVTYPIQNCYGNDISVCIVGLNPFNRTTNELTPHILFDARKS